MTKMYLGLAAAIFVIVGLLTFSNVKVSNSVQESAPVSGAADAMHAEDVMAQEMAQRSGDVMAQGEGEPAMMQKSDTPGIYEPYAPEKLSAANNGRTVLLFFHAPWCPICAALEKEIKTYPSRIPAGVTLLKVDYDSETALKQKYGVTYQHTIVAVDAQGNMLKKWGDVFTLAELKARLNQ